MLQKKTGFTTMVDLREFNETTWAFLTNITMTWQYDGIAYLFRKEGIPLYGIDRGTMKMNHPIACMAVPQSGRARSSAMKIVCANAPRSSAKRAAMPAPSSSVPPGRRRRATPKR